MNGLLLKSVSAFFLIAFSSFFLSYLYTVNSQSVEIKNELNSIKNQGNEALNVVVSNHVDQLISYAEELFSVKGSHVKEQSDAFEYIEKIWPRIKISHSLRSLFIKSNNEFLLGDSLPNFIIQQAINAQKDLLPYHRIHCHVNCEIAISIPLFIDKKTASLTLSSELLPTVIYASKSLHMDIGLINESDILQQNEISRTYPFDILTNNKQNAKILEVLARNEISLSTIVNGYLYKNTLTNEAFYIWGSKLGNKKSPATFIFFKNVSTTMENYNRQQKSLLFQSATISFGIIIIVVILVFFPLKRLRILTDVIEKIGDKNYEEAKKTLSEFNLSKHNDELSSLSRTMNEALLRIEKYEKKIISNQKEFKKQATIDSLTQLFNRHAFIQNLTNLQNDTSDSVVALALIDLDGFKPINDNLGHEAGDQVLKWVGKRLNHISTDKVTSYRLGGDEFVVCIEDVVDDDIRYEQLVLLFNEHFMIDNTKLKITASIGIASGVLNSQSHSELLRRADIAMYQAKNLGKNRFCIFESAMMEHSNLRFIIANDFISSLKKGEIYLNFQPIINLKTGKIVKIEALSRWNHAQVGFIRPDIFIPIIEGTSYIKDLSNWLIKQCILQLMMLKERGFEDVIISINISAAEISNMNSINFIKDECKKNNISYHLIELEITETSLISNFKAAQEWVSRAQEIGFKVSIDDFGTGYSSLSYLTLFPFNTVKIDRSLIKNIPQDLNQQKIIKSIIRMLQELEVDVVVEGIEHHSQLDVMKQLGADMIQGYYFSKPLNQPDLYEFLASHRLYDGEKTIPKIEMSNSLG